MAALRFKAALVRTSWQHMGHEASRATGSFGKVHLNIVHHRSFHESGAIFERGILKQHQELSEKVHGRKLIKS